MPALDAVVAVLLVHLLLALGPAHVGGLAVALDAGHLLGHRQLCVDGGRKGMDQFRPRGIPQPEHGRADAAEGAKGVMLLGRFRDGVFDSLVFPLRICLVCIGRFFLSLDRCGGGVGVLYIYASEGWVRRTLLDLYPWTRRACRLCRLNSRCPRTRRIFDTCYMRIVGTGRACEIQQ